MENGLMELIEQIVANSKQVEVIVDAVQPLVSKVATAVNNTIGDQSEIRAKNTSRLYRAYLKEGFTQNEAFLLVLNSQVKIDDMIKRIGNSQKK